MCWIIKKLNLDDMADDYQLPGLKKEDRLNLNRNILGRLRGRYQIGKADDFFKIFDQKLTKYYSSIKLEHLKTLYNKLFDSDFRSSDPVKCKPGYATAIKFHYAVEGQSFRILYQPILLACPTQLSTTQKFYLYQEKDQADKKVYYRYSIESDFEGISENDFCDFTKKYSEKVRIRHVYGGGEDHIPFIQKVDSEHAIFSFQELFSLAYQNNNSDIHIYNAALRNRHDPYTEIRHTLVLSYRKYKEEETNTFWSHPIYGVYNAKNGRGFRRKLANLAHLCPPHRDIVYRLQEFKK